MIISAEMKLKASIMHKERRCSHYRLDYPNLDDQNWRVWINIYKGAGGTMQLEKQAFDSWPPENIPATVWHNRISVSLPCLEMVF